MITAALKIADAVLIPVQPSPYDIWAAADLVELIRARQEVTGGRPQAAFLVARVVPRAVLSREIGAALAEYGLPVFSSGTAQRQCYARSAAGGRTVFEGGSKAAAAEIEGVADELLARFDPETGHGA